MEVGIGLPATVPGVDGESLVEWARRSEDRGFSSLGAIDRLVYPNYEPLIALAAAAAVTDRVRLTTDILISPLRTNTPLLAKQASTIDNLSGGRLTLGVAVGAREDDYTASGLDPGRRGAVLDDQLEEMKRVWSGEERGFAGAIGPPPARDGGPELLVGGHVPAAIRRAARFADGWTMGGGAPDQFAQLTGQLKEAWSEEGRSGSPRCVALAYFALGPDARELADKNARDYYGFGGDELVGIIAQSTVVDEGMVKGYIGAFEEAGADELILFPSSTDVEQVDLLAEARG